MALKLATLDNLTNLSIKFEIDCATDFYKYLNVQDRMLSVKNGYNGWFPVLLSKAHIQQRKSFEVAIMKAGNKFVMLGVTLFEHKYKPNNYGS
jgi:hypothetical protein